MISATKDTKMKYYQHFLIQWRAQASGGAGAKWRYEGTIADRGVCSPSARGITIHNFIMILCHVGFSILQAV